MSGFVCMLHGDREPIDKQLLQQMTHTMTKVCPDAQHTQIVGSLGLGHALLRTTWESATEQQPLSLDQKRWICGDIRLDRRDELRKKLRGKGIETAQAAPDVNLVLAAYQVWETDCVEHISGDFAFAVWDAWHQRLYCARDQFGVVPCYYAQIGHKLIISNHLQPIQQHPQISDNFNEQTLADFLLFGMNHQLDTTFFADIQTLPPAHSLTWQADKIHTRRYWQLPEQIDYLRYAQPEQYIEQFQELFSRSVADRLRTDKAGTHLSGGMDSTSIAVTAHKQLQASGKPFDFRAYCIQYDWMINNDEHIYAAKVAEKSGFPVEYLVAEDYILKPPNHQATWHYPEPGVIPNQLAEVEETRRIASFSRVLFAGFGGDPLLNPNPAYWRDLWKNRDYRRLIQEGLKPIILGQRRPQLGIRTRLHRCLGQTSAQLKLPNWYNPDFVKQVDLTTRWAEQTDRSPQKERYGMLTEPLWSSIFTRSDPGFTGFSVKTRFPFFDLKLAECLLRMPSYPWFNDKTLLRQAMQDQLPESVRLRRKTTLQGMPDYQGFQSQGRLDWVPSLLNTSRLKHYVDVQVILGQLASTKNTPEIRKIMPLIQLAYWCALRTQHFGKFCK